MTPSAQLHAAIARLRKQWVAKHNAGNPHAHERHDAQGTEQRSHGSRGGVGFGSRATLITLLREGAALGLDIPDRDTLKGMDDAGLWALAAKHAGSEQAVREMIDSLPERGEGENLRQEDARAAAVRYLMPKRLPGTSGGPNMRLSEHAPGWKAPGETKTEEEALQVVADALGLDPRGGDLRAAILERFDGAKAAEGMLRRLAQRQREGWQPSREVAAEAKDELRRHEERRAQEAAAAQNAEIAQAQAGAGIVAGLGDEPEMQAALTQYTGVMYEAINPYAAGGFEKIKEHAYEYINEALGRDREAPVDREEASRLIDGLMEQLDAAFERVEPYEGEPFVVYRGWRRLDPSAVSPGDIVDVGPYSSTSYDEEEAAEFDSTKPPVRITVEPGARYIDVDDTFEALNTQGGAGRERELIFPRGTSFRVDQVDGDGTVHVTALKDPAGSADDGDMETVTQQKQWVEGDVESYYRGLQRIDEEFPGFVSVYEPEHYRGANVRVFTSPDGQVGYNLTDHGDGRIEVAGVYNWGDERGAAQDALKQAVADGANYLEAYDGFLPFNYFDVVGAVPSDRWPWDDQYRHERWQEDKYGTPGVVTMDIPRPDEFEAESYEERRRRFLEAYEKVGGGEGVPEAILEKGKARLNKAAAANAGFASAREFAEYMLDNPQRHLPDVFN